MVRLATIEDVPAIAAGENGIWETLPLPGSFDRDGFITRLTALMKTGRGVVIADFAEDGTVTSAMGGYVSLEFSSSFPIAQQIFWTANRKRKCASALKVLKEFEKECQRLGAKVIFITALFDANMNRMSSVFKRFGYRPAQVQFIKGL